MAATEPKPLRERIRWHYERDTYGLGRDGYYVYVDDVMVFHARDERERGLFVGELLLRVSPRVREHLFDVLIKDGKLPGVQE